jgi:hypothetical protein
VNAACVTEATEAGTECADDGGVECNGQGQCVALANGRPCAEAGACASMLCVDGVCCDAVCDGACESCNSDDTKGSCAPLPVGLDPAEECPEHQVCGESGICLGQVAWAVSAMTQGSVDPQSLAVGPADDVIVAGIYADGNYGTLSLSPLGLIAPTASPYWSAVFVAKVAASGGQAGSWLTTFPVAINEHEVSAYGLDVDSSGNVYVGGYVRDGAIDLGDGSGPQSPQNLEAGYVAKLAAGSGYTTWSKFLAASQGLRIEALSVGPDNAVAITGSFAGTVDFGGGAVASAGGSLDVFVAVYEPSGPLRWMRHYGDASTQVATNVAVLAGGEVAFLGTFAGVIDFGNAGMHAAMNTSSFIAVLTPQGTPQWSGLATGSGAYMALLSIAATGDGEVVFGGPVAGSVTVLDDPLSSAPASGTFVAKYSPYGEKRWLRTFGDGLLQIDPSPLGARNYLAADGRDVIFVVGATGPAIDFGLGPIGNQAANDHDLFLVRLDVTTGDTVLNYHFHGPSDERATTTALGQGVVAIGGTHRGMSFGGMNLPAGDLMGNSGFVALLTN